EYAKLGPALQEILNRFQLVEMMSADMRQEEDNKKTASAVYELLQQDEYLAEKMILPEELHTMGFLECTRANFDYLDSVESVRVSGNNHLRALQIFLDITDAALQAVAQHQAQISALEKARKEEAEFMKKEERRLQKQKEDEQKKAEKKAEKEAKKRKAEEAKALAAEAKKRAGPHPDEPQDEEKPKTGSGKARKGKGAGDLSESDHAILRAKLPGRAVPVLRDGKSF
ncbi:unnamed protein product, partial [Durusdinium trenchii]